MIEIPKNLLPTVFDWEDPASYVPPRVAHDYARLHQPSTESRRRFLDMPGKWAIIGAAGATALTLTAVGFGKQTLGEGFRAIFPDDSPPITHPVKKIVDNHG